MTNARRVVVNTAAQYIRTGINLCLALFSTRLVLDALGVEDYGIYTLIAGIVALLSFMVNAMVVTTQRFMSYWSGRGDLEKLKEIFCNSIFIHLSLGLIVAWGIEVIGLFLFDGFFNISPLRIDAARTIYHIVTCMLVLTFLTAPFRALLISHENIVYISIVDVIDGVLKLLIAIFVAQAHTDRLILYVSLFAGIQFLNLLVFSIFDYAIYPECILPRRRYLRLSYIREISSFAGWTIYSVGCFVGRNQGIAVVLNKLVGVVANAAYGVALQVNGAILFLARSLMNAMNPQIMKAEGAGDRARMLRLAEIESKFCFLLIGMIVIPVVLELPALLSIWLKQVPENAVLFCSFILVYSLIDQFTIGLEAANQAVGDIKGYSLAVNTIKLLTIIPVGISLIFSSSLSLAMSFYLIFGSTAVVVRLFYVRRTAGLSIRGFVRKVFAREVLPVASTIIACLLIINLTYFSLRFLLTIAVSVSTMALTTYLFGLCPDERQMMMRLLPGKQSNAIK